MAGPCEVIKEYRVTEKASRLIAGNCYTFEVASNAGRSKIKSAVEGAFKVKVKKVCILNRKAKVRRNRMRRASLGSVGGMKKAMVTLSKGYKIDIN